MLLPYTYLCVVFLPVFLAMEIAERKSLFIEIGLNRGQTFIELTSAGSKNTTDRNLMMPILKNVLKKEFNPNDFCFYGFEANGVFTTELKSLESTLSNSGFCVRVHFNTAASLSNGNQTFYIDGRKGKMHGPGKKYFAEGSTLEPGSGHKLHHMTSTVIQTIDIKEYIATNLLDRDAAILRIDIEGAEYSMLEYLLSPSTHIVSEMSGKLVICSLTLLIVEFHIKRNLELVSKQHSIKRKLDSLCPNLRVVLDPSNYLVSPFKETWELPEEWKNLDLAGFYE